MPMKHKGIFISALVLACAVSLTGCSTASNSGTATTAASSAAGGTAKYLAPKKDGPYKVALADSFTDNTWRTQVTQEFNYACQNTYKDKVTCLPAADANHDTGTQISQISNFITQGVDILLVDANDGSALNQVIQQANAAGIQVVDFDNVTTSEYAIHVGEDQTQIGKLGGEWLASLLKSGDTVISLDGISGNPTSDQRKAGADAALAAAGIKIVARADTNWDRATAQTAAASLLAANPGIKAVYSQGGDSSLGAIAAMQQLGMQVLPIPGEGSNGFLKAWQALSTSQPGFTSWAFASPPQLVVNALDVAIKARQGTDPGQTVNLDIPVITQDTLAKNVKPNLNDNLWLPTQLPDDFLQANYAN